MTASPVERIDAMIACNQAFPYPSEHLPQPVAKLGDTLLWSLPKELQSSLPTVEAIEAELAEVSEEQPAPKQLPAKKRKGGTS